MKESPRSAAKLATAPRSGLHRLLLCVAVLLVFCPALRCGFVAWDDDINVYQNPHLKPATAQDVLWFWEHPYQKLYVPLTYSAWSAVAAVSQAVAASPDALPPLPFHALNLLFHVLNVLLVFSILRLLLPAVLGDTGPPNTSHTEWAAWAGAMLFALHPLQVESVVWISALKDLLSGFFSLLAIREYLAFAASPDRKGWKRCAWALAAFAAALLSKPSAAAVPGMLFLLDAFFYRGWRRALASLAPWFAAGAAVALLTRSAQPVTGIYPDSSLWPRFVVAGDAISFYLFKLAWPLSMTVEYGRKPAWLLAQSWKYATASLPLAVAAALYFLPRRRLWLVAAGILLAGIAPVLGLIPFNHQTYSTVADRYMYVAMLGPALVFAALFALLSRRSASAARLFAALLLLPAGLLSAASISPWHDTISLFEHCLEVNPLSSTAHNNLGYTLEEQGRLQEALRQYLDAIQADPKDGRALNNLGNFYLMRRGDVDAARLEYAQAIESGSDLVNAHNNMGVALEKQGQLAQAVAEYQTAIRLDPNYASAYNDLGNVLSRMKNPAAALAAYAEALQLDPTSRQAHLNMAKLKARLNDDPGSRAEFAAGLGAPADSAAVYAALGQALEEDGRTAAAIAAYREGLKAAADSPSLSNDLGFALAGQGQWTEAIAMYRKALALEPDAENTLVNLGNAFMATAKPAEAEALWSGALVKLPGSYKLRHDLGILLLRQGRRAEAEKQFREALRLKPDFEPSRKVLDSLRAS